MKRKDSCTRGPTNQILIERAGVCAEVCGALFDALVEDRRWNDLHTRGRLSSHQNEQTKSIAKQQVVVRTSTPTMCLPSPALGSCTCGKCVIVWWWCELLRWPQFFYTQATGLSNLEHYLHVVVEEVGRNLRFLQWVFIMLLQHRQ